MSIKLSDRMKKRFYTISFIVLPILFISGFFICIRIAGALSYNVEDRGILLVALSFIPLYLICVFTAYRALSKKSKDDQ